MNSSRASFVNKAAPAPAFDKIPDYRLRLVQFDDCDYPEEVSPPAVDRGRAHLSTGWIPCAGHLPPDDVPVETAIPGPCGLRAVDRFRRRGESWLLTDKPLLVSVRPSHWRFHQS